MYAYATWEAYAHMAHTYMCIYVHDAILLDRADRLWESRGSKLLGSTYPIPWRGYGQASRGYEEASRGYEEASRGSRNVVSGHERLVHHGHAHSASSSSLAGFTRNRSMGAGANESFIESFAFVLPDGRLVA